MTGLVCAGGVGRSFLARMPVLLAALGPVKAESFRVARRMSNTLRAGFAVPDYPAFEPCYLIWIFVPDAMLDDVLRDMAARTPLDRTMVVVCGSAREARSVAAGRGRLASLNVVEESKERTFVAEGHPDALRELRRLADAEGRKLIEIRPERKALYLAGVNLAARLILPWIAAAVESLRAAGFSRSEAARTVEALGEHSLRAYGRAGRKAWNPAASIELRAAAKRDLETIRLLDPSLAEQYAEGIKRYLGSG